MWNKIEHKLVLQISLNWKGIPLVDYQTVVQLIGTTKNAKGLTIKCQLDSTEYQKGIKITDEEMNRINLIKIQISWGMELCRKTHLNVKVICGQFLS
ncbi:MAG: hypothetical protein EZS26_003276 [Candidatus Ordinivivax streblomastigis]|uniref:Uncharacterized protein n=1 Tax=Candidatus Ordinivivax streblomastigis TaxID=2540710 RepID=A0A5M8NUN4_9BACT|nr:MAG: hypothetical protein EZS26_003276 [Candidatus Ordinivivax streblomastigis]